MYITCEQCSTIFRLDEKRLKPTGSKVRCCQCRNVFVAWPTAPSDAGLAGTKDIEDATAQFVALSPTQHAEDTFDRELEGIDLAELDSILDQNRSEDFSTSADGQGDRAMASAAEEPGDFEESDLDMDFESELALDDDRPAESTADVGEEPGEDLDLDMDFELETAAASDAPETSAEDQLVADDLDMDFELGEDLDQQAETLEQSARIDTAGDVLGEDIDSVLNDFEDVLNEVEEVEGGASPGIVEGGVKEAEEEIDLSDLEDVLEIADETEAAAEDVDLGDIDAALDMPAVEEDIAGEDDFDIDLSDLDMDLDGEDLSDVVDEGDQAGFSLDEKDAIALEEAPASKPDDVSAAADDAQGDEYDLSDLEGLMDLDGGEDEAAEESFQGDAETELSLDEDLTLDEEPPSDEQEEEVFDLSDLDGLMDLDGGEDEAAEETVESDDETELFLEFEEEPSIEVATDGDAAGDVMPEDQADELDLSDLGGLDAMLDEDQPADESELEELELSLDDEDGSGVAEDQELTLEMDTDTEPAGGPDAGAEDHGLDLGGLDNLLDEEGESADESEPEDLELSLDDEFEPTAPEELSLDISEDEEAGEVEDLEFAFDSEFEDKPAAKSAEEGQEAADEDEELDLTDLEKMLENETLVPESGPQIQDSDLSLDGGSEGSADSGADALGLGSAAELDLSEIEAAIDSAEEDMEESGDNEQELELELESSAEEDQEPSEAPGEDLELELELEGDSATAEGDVAEDYQDAIDLSDLNLSLEEKLDAEGEVINAGDMELEFQIEDEMEPATIDSAETMSGDVATATYTKTAVQADDDTSLIEEAFAGPLAAGKEDVKPAPVKKRKKKKKRSSAGLIVLLILILLGAGGYFGYQYAVKNNIPIPLLSDLIHLQPQDPSGTAMLTTLDINSKFIENEKGGRIFVVTGKIRNGYPVPCNKIQLQGKLFSRGKVLAKTESVYAGVMISDLELAGQEVAQIKQRLKTGGGQTAELVVNSGQSLPFMVVFSDLPADLDEFAIELLSSTKVQ